MRAFRIDEREFSEGDLILYRGDCEQMLSADERVVEAAIRSYAPNSADIRRHAQYFYRDEDVAKRLAKLDRRNLYEVEIADCKILHQGDLNHYSAAKDAVGTGLPLDPYIAGYWSGLPAGPPNTGPRFELLAVEALVVRKL